jgi:hypothetical protein
VLDIRLAPEQFSISYNGDMQMAKQKKNGKTTRHNTERRAWTKEDQRELRTHSKAKTPVTAISKEMKRTVGALRQQALKLGISLGHRR